MLTNTMLLDTDTVQLLLHVQYMEEDEGHMEKRAKMKKWVFLRILYVLVWSYSNSRENKITKENCAAFMLLPDLCWTWINLK